MSSARPSSRIEGIDLLRAAAALSVVVAHALDTVGQLGDRVDGRVLASLPDANAMAAAGVDLFFVISGFVMAHAISRAAGPPSVGQFLGQRVRRIVPLFLLASVAYGALLARDGYVPTAAALLNTLTLLPLADWGAYSNPPLYVGWTLAFEAGFYLLVAGVLAAGVAQRRAVLLALTVAVAVIGLVVDPAWLAARVILNPIMAEFALGVAAHLAWQRGWTGMRPVRVLIGLAICALAALIVHPVIPRVNMHFDDVIHGRSGLIRTLVLGLPLTLVLLGALGLKPGGRVRQGFDQIGRSSYSLYLVHPIVMLAVVQLGFGGARPDAWWLAIGLVALAVSAGLLMYRFVEQPLLAALRPRRKPVAQLAAA